MFSNSNSRDPNTFNPSDSYNPPSTNTRTENFGAAQIQGRIYEHQQVKRAIIQPVQEISAGRSSISVGNGVKLVNAISLELDTKNPLVAKILRTIWLNSVTGANWFPYGSAINMANYPCYTEGGVVYFSDSSGATLTRILQYQEQSIFVVTNSSGSTQTFIIDGIVRYVTNEAGIGKLP